MPIRVASSGVEQRDLLAHSPTRAVPPRDFFQPNVRLF